MSFLFIWCRASPSPGTILKPEGVPATLPGPGGGAGAGGGGGGAGGGIIIVGEFVFFYFSRKVAAAARGVLIVSPADERDDGVSILIILIMY